MNPKLIDYLAKMYPLSDEFTDVLQRAISQKSMRKGHILQQKGSWPSIWFLESGLAKGCYHDPDGKEHATRFWKPGEFMLLANNPVMPMSADRIVLLENSTVTIIRYAAIPYLYQRFPEAPKLATKILLMDRDKAEQRAFLCTLPSDMAYHQFRKLFPSDQLFLKDAASFLEISRGRLSEIKKNLQ